MQTRRWLGVVSVVMAKPAQRWAVAAPGRLFPVFLVAAGGQVEPVVCAVEDVAAARLVGVRVEDTVAVAQEAADSEHLSRQSLPFRAEFGEAPVVVLDRGDVVVEGDVEVVVEVAAEVGVPGDGSAQAAPCGAAGPRQRRAQPWEACPPHAGPHAARDTTKVGSHGRQRDPGSAISLAPDRPARGHRV
jgi:hypothetical protein